MHGLKFLSFARSVIVLILILVPSIAIGHPGHGASRDTNSIIHYLTSPIHAVPALTGILAAVWVIRWTLKSNSARDES